MNSISSSARMPSFIFKCYGLFRLTYRLSDVWRSQMCRSSPGRAHILFLPVRDPDKASAGQDGACPRPSALNRLLSAVGGPVYIELNINLISREEKEKMSPQILFNDQE